MIVLWQFSEMKMAREEVATLMYKNMSTFWKGKNTFHDHLRN